jgi:hypothetical protein
MFPRPRPLARLRPAPLLAAGVALLTLAACGPKIRFSDSVDNEFDLRLTTHYDDRLHQPYVAGARFKIYAYDITEDNDLDGWTIVSLDPDVLDVLSVEVIRDELDEDEKAKTDIISAEVVTVGPGTATLEVHDDHGDFVRATEVEVMQPDNIELHAAGPMFIDDESRVPSPVDTTPKILANGTATFYVEWFKGEQKLHGAGTLELDTDNPHALNLWDRQSLLDEDRDWATLEFESPADGQEVATVTFSANGLPVADYEFEIVQPEAISYVELVGVSEAGREDGDLLVVLAQAFDDNDESIWGVAFDWDIDGRSEPGEGDLFRYWFERGIYSELRAEYYGVSGEMTIQGRDGFVDSSNNISCFCTANERAPGRGVALGLLCLASLGLVRRRRETVTR